MASWRRLITETLESNGETWADIIKVTLSNEELDTEFHAGYGLSQGKPFTAWTKNHVYFPAVYDGAEWCASVPRNPCDEATPHIGGE